MSRVWLVPLKSRDPLTLGGERLGCDDPDSLQALRLLMQEVHPRALMLFKTASLLAEEESAIPRESGANDTAPFDTGKQSSLSCGVSMARLELNVPGEVTIGGTPGAMRLSSCAEALLNRLPAVAEVKRWMDDAPIGRAGLPAQAAQWLEAMQRWHGEGWDVILLKEDGQQ
ncbi:hypothetical protein [Paenibacillus sp. y28]|uniref:hypothetical protein n=1 Tax=Paenibacillus sp. y28 TaxID=3129110 RepID=UPI003017BDC9